MVCRAEDAHRYTDSPRYGKALSGVAGNGSGLNDPGYDHTTFHEVAASAADAYAQAGISAPRSELAMAAVHDCFTPPELVLMEDLGLCERGTALKEGQSSAFEHARHLSLNPARRPNLYGDLVGAHGTRMVFAAGI